MIILYREAGENHSGFARRPPAFGCNFNIITRPPGVMELDSYV